MHAKKHFHLYSLTKKLNSSTKLTFSPTEQLDCVSFDTGKPVIICLINIFLTDINGSNFLLK